MKTDWLYELRLDNGCTSSDGKAIVNAVKEIRETLDEKGCKFSITAVVVLDTLLTETERQAQGRIV